MRAIAIFTFVALIGAWSSACCDCAEVVEEKQGQVTDLEEQVSELEAKIAELEQAAAEQPAEEPAAARPVEAAPQDLESCIERLKACELDPFKGGKYFTPEKVDPRAGTAAPGAASKDLIDPFKDKPKAEAKAGDVKDPFAKK